MIDKCAKCFMQYDLCKICVFADPPSVSKLTLSRESSYIGQMVTFTCTADGDPAPEYSWKTPDNRTSFGNSTLVVLLYSAHQFGVYTCIINNTHGQTTRNVTLQQLCKYYGFYYVVYRVFEINYTTRNIV